jgi:RNA polymerase sigma factor (sigma-70 family)
MEAAALGFGSLLERRSRERALRELEQLRPQGIAFLVRHFGPSLSHADAEDAIAEVVIRLHRKVDSGDPPRNLRAAFFTSARNAAIDQLRSRAVRPTAPLELVAEAPALEPTPLESAEGKEQSVRLREALERMRPNYREAILMRFGLGMSVPEIAERRGISLPAAKKLVLRSTAQVRDRLSSIEGLDFCPDMRASAERSIFDREAAGLASDLERGVLEAHFSHCGSCRSFLTELRSGLHELGGTALVAGLGGSQHLGIASHISGWASRAIDLGHAAHGRARLFAYKASGLGPGGDAASAGALGGTAQKIAAVCSAATAGAATCLATGIVGPGIGAKVVDHPPQRSQLDQPALVRTIDEEPVIPTSAEVEPPPSEEPATEPEPSPESGQASEPEPTPEPNPAEESGEQFGFESSETPVTEPAPAPPARTPSTSAPSAGGGSGGEAFGFGG